MSSKRLAQIAWGVWAVSFLAVSVMVVHNWKDHSEGVIYSKAVTDWWGNRNLYGVFRYDGFLYFPHAAILYSPFTFMKHPLGDIAWRLAGLAFLVGGIYRFAKLCAPNDVDRVFAIASFIAIFPCLASLRNGQSNLHIAAAMLQAAADLAEKRWWRASIWLMIGLAIKPIMMVMILLAGAVYRPMSWRLAIALVLFVLLPFATRSPDYVWAQYRGCYEQLTNAAQPDRAFCDFRGLLYTMHILISQRVELGLQLVAAAAALAICWMAHRRWIEPWPAAVLFAITAIYLMLFNPRTESNSYVILSPAVGLAAGLISLDLKRVVDFWIVVAISLALWSDGWGYKWTHLWLKQIGCIVFLILLIREMARYIGTNAQRTVRAEQTKAPTS
jgi:alpha-1,2-mannosyltransferase